MRVKRYVVDSMPDALQRIRSDLGKDAVILNTKEVRSGGFLGFFSRKQIEVIAAIDSIAASAGSAGSAAVQSIHQKPASPERIYSESPTNSQGSLSNIAATLPVTVMEHKTGEVQTDQAAKENRQTSESKSDQLSEEIKEMKKMMYSLINQGNEHTKMTEAFMKIQQQLLIHEFDPLLVQDILHKAMEQAEVPVSELADNEARDLVKKQLKEMVTTDLIKGISDKTKIIHFIGPTGVGKTTTIAKLAAEQVLKHHKKVGFITCDTYRIAAVEQLKTYATILNVPLEVVYSPQDIKKALSNLQDRDIIFMDTAGRNFRNEMYVSELNSLLKSQGDSETYLVLSLTMKYKDMKVVTNNFSKFKVDKILFTKKDETDSFGSIFNIIRDFPLMLSYITNGQNVPDDISKINIDEFIEQILEENQHE
jgi:flagellar biosynthesis protein FlhF